MKTYSKESSTIGILYPGEMGCALAKCLSDEGFRVVSTAEGRSGQTKQRAEQSGLPLLATFDDVVRAADVAIVVVPPAAAIEVAERYCSLAAHAPAGASYVDVTPLTPVQKHDLAKTFGGTRVQFVDGAICGSASHLRKLGRIYLSGESADRVAQLLTFPVPVKCLGQQPGQASLLKMFMGGMSKGLAMLFVELAVAAKEGEILGEVLDCWGHFYPGVITAVERMLPSYPGHAGRRADELGEVETTMRELGVRPNIIAGVRAMLESIAAIEPSVSEPSASAKTVTSVIEQIHAAVATPPTEAQTKSVVKSKRI
jgi:3-hydroxyisobutyrate dehydrogenase-like beta-hydroxyacid dehydrogenase